MVEENGGQYPSGKIALGAYEENRTLNCQTFLFKGINLQLKYYSGHPIMVLHKNSTLLC